MEKAFRIESNAKYYIDLEKYIELVKNQRKQVKEFLKTYGIKATKYRVGGNGSVNQSFREYWKDEITLEILPTIEDKHDFATMLRKPYDSGICDFKKKSKINKIFQDYCIEK